MNILVTGSSGFIGKELVSKLRKKYPENHIIGLDIISKERLSYYIIADITSKEILNHPIWSQIDYVYHLAAMANLDNARENRGKCLDVNLWGTYNIIRVCKKYNIPLCFISTCCVYGNTTEHPTTESAPTHPTEIYAVSKLTGETLVKSMLDKWIIVRFSTVLGPSMREALATHIFLSKAIKGEPIPIHGTGKQTRTWIYIDDLIEALILILEKKVNKEIINIAGSTTYSVLKMGEFCDNIVGNKAHSFIFMEDREGQVYNEEISIEKAKRLLDWKPKVELQEGLRRCYEKWKKNLNG